MYNYIKPLFIIVALLMLIVPAKAQRQTFCSYNKVEKSQFDSCNRIKQKYLIPNSQTKKQSGKLKIPVSKKSSIFFQDDSSDENFHKFEYLGDISGTKLAVLKRINYNSEEFYLINRSTGTIDTLIGLPVFAQNMRDFACINNPGTDEKQQIQVCEIKNGSAKTRIFLKGKSDSFLEYISCITRNSILAKDNEGNYWKLNFKAGDE